MNRAAARFTGGNVKDARLKRKSRRPLQSQRRLKSGLQRLKPLGFSAVHVVAKAVLYHDMRYTVYQDIRYTSALGFGSLLGRLVGSPKGDRRAFPTARGRTSARVHPW